MDNEDPRPLQEIKKIKKTKKIENEQIQRIREEAAKLGTTSYKFIEPFIINLEDQIRQESNGVVDNGVDIRNGKLNSVKIIPISNIKKDLYKNYELSDKENIGSYFKVIN